VGILFRILLPMAALNKGCGGSEEALKQGILPNAIPLIPGAFRSSARQKESALAAV